MSKDLATIPTQLPAHLRQADAATDEFESGIGAGFPLPFLSIRGKEFRFRKDGQELNTRLRELNVVLIAARPAVSKRFYATQYESGSTEAPDCSSLDGKVPDVDEPVNDKCATCPKNAWGSKITDSGKEGKACQDYKRLVVWPLEQLSEYTPVLDLSATNMKFSKEQRKERAEMDFATYLQALKKHGISPHHVVTSISFTDADYPQLAFAFGRFVDEDELARVEELRAHEDVVTVLGSDLHETSAAPEQETEAKPEPETKQEAPPKKKAPAKKKAASGKATGAKSTTEKKQEPRVFLWNMGTDEGGEVPESKASLWEEDGYQIVSEKMYRKLKAAAGEEEPSPSLFDKQEAEANEKEARPEATEEGHSEEEDAGEKDIMAEISKMLS